MTNQAKCPYCPMSPHVFKTYPRQFRLRELMIRVFQKGKVVYESPSLNDIRENSLRNLGQLNPTYKRFHNPHQYHVSLSPLLFKIKQRLLRQAAAGETTTASS